MRCVINRCMPSLNVARTPFKEKRTQRVKKDGLTSLPPVTQVDDSKMFDLNMRNLTKTWPEI